MRAYHDAEWGVPIRDERHLFELLVLEGAQAGLSWNTILRKRDGYRRAFAGFEPACRRGVRRRGRRRLLADPGIVRNRAKVAAAIDNARATLALQAAGDGLVDHLWSFVGGAPIVNRIATVGRDPVRDGRVTGDEPGPASRSGFRFVGPTICYALMQSAGLVNDHEVACFRWAEVQEPA